MCGDGYFLAVDGLGPDVLVDYAVFLHVVHCRADLLDDSPHLPLEKRPSVLDLFSQIVVVQHGGLVEHVEKVCIVGDVE